MSGLHFSAEQLSRYIEGELPQAEAEQLGRHLERCGQCREQMESLQRMLATLGRLPDLAPSPGFLARLEERIATRRSLWRRLAEGFSLAFLPLPARAAALAVVVLLGTGIIYFSGRPSAPPGSIDAPRLAKEKQSPSKAPAMLAPQRGVGMQQEVLDQEQPSSRNKWFLAREAQKSAQEEDLPDLAEQSRQAAKPLDDAIGWKDKETKPAAGTEARESGAPVSSEEAESLHALGYLFTKSEPALMPSEDFVQIGKAPAAPSSGVERAELEETILAMGAGRAAPPKSVPPAAALAETAAKPSSPQAGDVLSGPAEERLKHEERWASDRANQPVPARTSRAAGYFDAALEGTTTLFSPDTPGGIELLVSSAQPQQTAETLQAWLAIQPWLRGKPALAVEDGTAVLTVYVSADSVTEATEAILAQASGSIAGGIARVQLEEYARAVDYFYQQYPAEVPASSRSEIQARLPGAAGVSSFASEATQAHYFGIAGRPEVLAASLPQATYRQVRIRVVREVAATE